METENRIADYVESIAMSDLHIIIDDICKTEELITKLSKYKDDAEDIKMRLKESLVGIRSVSEGEKINNDIAECDKIIKGISSDISYIKTTSRLYVFYKKARKILPKDMLNEIELEVNNSMFINKLAIGDELTCIIPCEGILRGEPCECSNIDKFNGLIAVKGKNGFHNANHFKLIQEKL